MSFSIIVPSAVRAEQQQSVQDRVSAMTIEELESQVFEDSMLLGYLSDFGAACEREMEYRRSAHRTKVKVARNSVFGALSQDWVKTAFADSSIPVIRKVVPGLIASEIVGIQPAADTFTMSKLLDGYKGRNSFFSEDTATFLDSKGPTFKKKPTMAEMVAADKGKIDWMTQDLVTERFWLDDMTSTSSALTTMVKTDYEASIVEGIIKLQQYMDDTRPAEVERTATALRIDSMLAAQSAAIRDMYYTDACKSTIQMFDYMSLLNSYPSRDNLPSLSDLETADKIAKMSKTFNSMSTIVRSTPSLLDDMTITIQPQEPRKFINCTVKVEKAREVSPGPKFFTFDSTSGELE